MTPVEPEDLIGSHEAVEIAGMKRSTFAMARTRGEVPEPIVTLACGPIWTRSQIEEWVAERAARRPS